MLSVIDVGFVFDLADVDRVGQQSVDGAAVDRPTATRRPLPGRPGFVAPPSLRQFLDHRHQRPEFQVETEDAADLNRLLAIDHQLRARPRTIDVVTKHRDATRPFPPATLGRNLVTDPLADDLTLELGERQQDVERQPAHRMGRVELLGHRNERDAIAVERLHDPRKVEQGAAQAVDLVDDHTVDLASGDVGQQPVQRRPVHAAT